MIRALCRLGCLSFALAYTSACDEKKPEPPPPPPEVVKKPEEKKVEPAEEKVVAQEITVTSPNAEAVTTFKRGRYLVENARIDEGVTELRKAVSLDKKFPLALAYLGFFTPTEEGVMMLERAASLSSELPKPEKLYVEHLLAWRRGDMTLLTEQRKALADIAAGDWRVQYEIGDAAREERNWGEAERRFQKAIALNDNAGAAYNMLGLSLIEQGKFDAAVASLNTYAEKMPQEPTPHDSIGEALMRAGKLKDAEAAFLKATELVPSYTKAWFGVAQTRFLQGDVNGGRMALTNAAKHAAGPTNALEAKHFTFWSAMAQKDWKAANAAVDDLERTAKAARDGRWHAMAPVLRAAISSESGKHAAVAPAIGQAMTRAQNAELAGEALSEVLGFGQLWKLRSELQLKKLAAAEASIDLMGKAIQLAPGVRTLSMRSHANGLLSQTRGDTEIAIQQLLECAESDYLCRVDLYRAQKVSNPDAAEKTLRAVLESPRREPVYLYAWANLKSAANAEGAP